MDVGTLEQWLWDAACEIRGPLDAPKFKDYILALVFLKRLSDVFDDESARLADEFGDEEKARALVEADHSLVRFYIPEEARWSAIATKTTGLGEYLTDAVRAVARENPELQGVIDVQDFNETAAGQRTVDDARLQLLEHRWTTRPGHWSSRGPDVPPPSRSRISPILEDQPSWRVR